MMGHRSGFENLWHGIRHFNRRQKLLAASIFIVVILTWLAVCALFLSLFV